MGGCEVVPLKFRLTPRGKRNQAADELEGWKQLVNTCRGTGSEAAVDAVVTLWALAPNDQNAVPPHQKTPLAINTNHANYGAWKPAHKIATSRARQERLRLEEVQRRHLPAVGANACQIGVLVNPIPQTLRVAILVERTTDDQGTKLSKSTARSINQLLAHQEKSLAAVEKELKSRSRHKRDHDLRSSGKPPIQVFLSTEWYYRPAGRPYTVAERATIITGLQELSRKYPDWLIIPGTIYWSPDPYANATIRVYNQAPILAAGAVFHTRTKRSSHDIAGNKKHHERWGIDSALPHPPLLVNAASIADAIFNYKGYQWCLEICRDHAVGEAINGFISQPGNPVGAHVYLMTANGTTKNDHFYAARDQGIVAYCDGGSNAYGMRRLTRPTALHQLQVQYNAYRTPFVAQRAHHILASAAGADLAARERSPLYRSFMRKFDAVFTGNPSSDNALKAAANAAQAAQILNLGMASDFAKRKALIDYVLGRCSCAHACAGHGVCNCGCACGCMNANHNQMPTANAVPPGEIAMMTAYSNSVQQYENEVALRDAQNDTVGRAKWAYQTASGATTATIGRPLIAIRRRATLRLHQLVNMP